MGDEDCGFTGEELFIEHDVNALAGGYDGFGIRVIHAEDTICEDAGAIDDDFGLDIEKTVIYGIVCA